MKRYLLKSDVFKRFNDETISNLVEDVEPLRVQRGDILLTQGEVGDMMYVIDKGEYNVIVDGKKVAVLKKRGHVFGELALISSQPRSATISAKSDGFVWPGPSKVGTTSKNERRSNSFGGTRGGGREWIR